MANTGSPSPSGRSGAGAGRRPRALTRGNLVTFFVAAMLCSASYCLGIWHNNRGAADSRVLGPSAALVDAGSCDGGGDARADDAPLDFETHHAADSAGLSVSVSAADAGAKATGARRALRGSAAHAVMVGHPSRSTGADGGDGRAASVRGDGRRFTHAGTVLAFIEAKLGVEAMIKAKR
ncbi:hypothetical protein ACP4OV_004093 [Aristida adscensionis]